MDKFYTNPSTCGALEPLADGSACRLAILSQPLCVLSALTISGRNLHYDSNQAATS